MHAIQTVFPPPCTEKGLDHTRKAPVATGMVTFF